MIDIALNLTDKAFQKDWVAVLERAREAGVEHMIVTGSTVENSLAARALMKSGPHPLSMTAGVHPHYADGVKEETWTVLEQLWAEPEVVAVGECGLDYFRDLSPRPLQREVFETQIEAAIRLAMPLFVHEREAGEEMLAILRAHRDRLGEVVVHCFTNSEEVLKAYLDLDLHIGITGWLCHETRGLRLREIVRLIPDNRLMIETDAPYLYPMSLVPLPRSRRNEPAFLGHICRALADCRGQEFEEVAELTTRNARRFFRLDDRR